MIQEGKKESLGKGGKKEEERRLLCLSTMEAVQRKNGSMID
jgi:hypothetical protein